MPDWLVLLVGVFYDFDFFILCCVVELIIFLQRGGIMGAQIRTTIQLWTTTSWAAGWKQGSLLVVLLLILEELKEVLVSTLQ